MKVQYKVDHTDEHGDFFPAGCVAEHTDAEAGRRIAAGVCERVADDIKALRYKLGDKILAEGCVSEPAEPAAEKKEPLVLKK